jgi:hypothetical protein
MPGYPRDMITVAERRFPVRIRVGVPPGGFGQRHAQITAWLDQNCGADGWAMTPSGMRGVLNDAVSIYFLDPTLASAFQRTFGTKTAEEIVRDDVLHLSYTSHDMAAFARDQGYEREPFPWQDDDRLRWRARLTQFSFTSTD